VCWRARFASWCDQAAGALIAALVLGSVLAFGGAVWWYRPVLAGGAFLLVGARLVQSLATGKLPYLKSPLTFLGILALGLAVLQLAPLPAATAGRLSPWAQEVYARGLIPELARGEDAEISIPDAPPIRSPASVDRSATLRWLVLAAACLGIFWSSAHFTDRLQRLYLVWGVVVAGFLLNAALALVQITNTSSGLYGVFSPGARPSWTPSLNDLLEAPCSSTLRNLADASRSGANAHLAASKAVLIPVTPFLFGTMAGGAGACLALGSLALPLGLAIVLHLVSPRGSRESLAGRLGYSSQGSLVFLLVVTMIVGAMLVGLAGGPWHSLPVVVGLAAAGLPALVRPGARLTTLGLVVLLLAGISLGAALEDSWPALLGGQSPVNRPDPARAQALWSDSVAILRAFPVVGAGLGCFGVIHPYFKDRDLSSTSAMSSLLQWGVESGAAGLSILALSVVWSLIRLPRALKRIGGMDRCLAHGLIGAALSFSLLAAVHWTVELSAVAVSASALGGTWNRWLAGGTDLFVERG
jgi:hypothetical protein